MNPPNPSSRQAGNPSQTRQTRHRLGESLQKGSYKAHTGHKGLNGPRVFAMAESHAQSEIAHLLDKGDIHAAGIVIIIMMLSLRNSLLPSWHTQ